MEGKPPQIPSAGIEAHFWVSVQPAVPIDGTADVSVLPSYHFQEFECISMRFGTNFILDLITLVDFFINN